MECGNTSIWTCSIFNKLDIELVFYHKAAKKGLANGNCIYYKFIAKHFEEKNVNLRRCVEMWHGCLFVFWKADLIFFYSLLSMSPLQLIFFREIMRYSLHISVYLKNFLCRADRPSAPSPSQLVVCHETLSCSYIKPLKFLNHFSCHFFGTSGIFSW